VKADGSVATADRLYGLDNTIFAWVDAKIATDSPTRPDRNHHLIRNLQPEPRREDAKFWGFFLQFRPEGLDVDMFDGLPEQEEWTERSKQPEMWTPKISQNEIWTAARDDWT
jgi:hypothetical protein